MTRRAGRRRGGLRARSAPGRHRPVAHLAHDSRGQPTKVGAKAKRLTHEQLMDDFSEMLEVLSFVGLGMQLRVAVRERAQQGEHMRASGVGPHITEPALAREHRVLELDRRTTEDRQRQELQWACQRFSDKDVCTCYVTSGGGGGD